MSGCASCPLRAEVAGEEDISQKCAHPLERERDVTGEEGVPEFCPLLRGPLVLFLDPAVRE